MAGAHSGWRRFLPLEVWPLGVFVVAVTGLASYRIYKLASLPDVQFAKHQWPLELKGAQKTFHLF